MKFFRRPSSTWLEILSELCVDLAAEFFIVLFAESLILQKAIRMEDILFLTSKLALGMLFLLLAKKLREDAK